MLLDKQKIVFLFSRINDLDHLIPVAYKTSIENSGVEIMFMPRTEKINFDVKKFMTYRLIDHSPRIKFCNLFYYLRLELFGIDISNITKYLFSSYYSGVFRKLQNKFMGVSGLAVKLDNNFYSMLDDSELIIFDHQMNEKNVLDRNVIRYINNKSMSFISIPHAYWHLKNGINEFKRQYEGVTWMGHNNLVSNSINWTEEFKETTTQNCLTLKSDRYSKDWYDVYFKKYSNKNRRSEFKVVLFETGGSPYERKENLDNEWRLLISSLSGQSFDFNVSCHTRSLLPKSSQKAYSNKPGLVLVMGCDVIITTYSSMAYDAFLLNKVIIWPTFLGKPTWRSEFDGYSDFYYVNTIDECISLLASFLDANKISNTIDVRDEACNGNYISDLILEKIK